MMTYEHNRNDTISAMFGALFHLNKTDNSRLDFPPSEFIPIVDYQSMYFVKKECYTKKLMAQVSLPVVNSVNLLTKPWS
jgi:hypothetical protein